MIECVNACVIAPVRWCGKRCLVCVSSVSCKGLICPDYLTCDHRTEPTNHEPKRVRARSYQKGELDRIVSYLFDAYLAFV